MHYKVTNNSASPRAIFHGARATHVGQGESRKIEMTEAEAVNAAAPGVEVEACDPDEAPVGFDAPGARAFFALADNAEGRNFRPLEVGAEEFVGIAVGIERPTDPAAYHFQPVTPPSDAAAPPAADEAEAGEATRAAPVLDDTLGGGAGADLLTGHQGGEDSLGGGAADELLKGHPGNDKPPAPPAADEAATKSAAKPKAK